jgi:hypothetical protein
MFLEIFYRNTCNINYSMFLEIFYRNTTVTVGHEFVKRDLKLFLPKRKNFLTPRVNSIFEEHITFFNTNCF